MSLIYDALRQSAPTGAGVAAPASSARGPSLEWWRRPLPWLVAGVLVAGPLGFLLARQAAPVGQDAAAPVATTVAPGAPVAVAAPDAAHIAVPMATQATGPLADAVPASPASPALPDASADQAPATAPAAGQPPPAAPAPAAHLAQLVADAGSAPVVESTAPAPQAPVPAPAPVAAPAPAPVAAPVAAAPHRDVQVVASAIEMSVTDASAAPRGGVDAVDADAAKVREAMGALHAAVGDGDDVAVQAALDRLQGLLPAQSLTLLRARAWAAHGGGDLAEARRLYRAIIDRVPDDEHASINLALLDARNGDVGEARARLDRLAARSSRSPQVLRALAELEAARR